MKAILSILDVRTLVIVALVLFIVFKKNGCSGGKSDKEIVYIGGKQMEVIKRDTVVEEKTHYQTIYKPGKDIIHDSLIYVEVPAKVDTASLLKDYFARVPYEDIIVLDSGLGYVKVFDTISENRIFTRRWEAFVKEDATLMEINPLVLVEDGRIIALDGKVTVYPNPNEGVFTLQSSVNARVTLQDALGRLILSKDIESGKTEINLGKTEKGIYFLNIQNANGIKVLKIVRE